MREIVFRAKRLDNGEWVEGYYGKKEIPTIRHFIMKAELLSQQDIQIFVDYEVDPDTVSQYTGLKDKNGKMIFEGDIIKTHHFKFNKNNEYAHYEKIGVIELSNSYEFGYRLRWKKGHMMLHNSMQIECKMDGEIIGNIIDNPELLN